MKRKSKDMNENNVKIIKISKNAIFEFIYEKFIDEQESYFDVDPLKVIDTFDMNFEDGTFIFCVFKDGEDGTFIGLPDEIDLQKLMKKMDDTTDSMFSSDRYVELTKDELIELCKD